MDSVHVPLANHLIRLLSVEALSIGPRGAARTLVAAVCVSAAAVQVNVAGQFKMVLTACYGAVAKLCVHSASRLPTASQQQPHRKHAAGQKSSGQQVTSMLTAGGTATPQQYNAVPAGGSTFVNSIRVILCLLGTEDQAA
jgi:hypothetical protein